VPEPKTKKNNASVTAFLKKAGGDRFADCQVISGMMAKATRDKPSMWGDAIVGFGSRPIVYANGDSLDWPIAAFSPRKDSLTIYGMRSSPKFAALTKKLGKHKMSGGCLHIKKLADVDTRVLQELITTSVAGGKAKKKAR
jgi:hypothetical protein